MKFLCDVHISKKIVLHIQKAGFESLHVNDILDSWFTKDEAIASFADTEDWIVVTKDADFRHSYFLKQSPKKLIKINLGNISNVELIKLIDETIRLLQEIKDLELFLLEVDKDDMTIIEIGH